MDRDQVRKVRSFNRAVTQTVGARAESYLRRGRPLGEARSASRARRSRRCGRHSASTPAIRVGCCGRWQRLWGGSRHR